MRRIDCMGSIYKVMIPEGIPYYIRTNEDGSLPLMNVDLYHQLLERNPLIRTELMGGGY